MSSAVNGAAYTRYNSQADHPRNYIPSVQVRADDVHPLIALGTSEALFEMKTMLFDY
jgi:hypothetical protein